MNAEEDEMRVLDTMNPLRKRPFEPQLPPLYSLPCRTREG